MPKPYTFPTILDEVKQVSITKLKEIGYFEPKSFKSGRLIWSRRGQEIGSINISISLKESPYIYLNYTFNKEEKVSYKINLVTVDSNLGIGKIWYFVCPHTGKRCRKLYSAGKYFLHRDAYPSAMYESQTYSKRGRQIDKVCKMALINSMRNYTTNILRLIMQASQQGDISRSSASLNFTGKIRNRHSEYLKRSFINNY